MVAAGHFTPEIAGLLGRERETPSLGTGWLLTLPQTRGFAAGRCPAPDANTKFSLQDDTLAQTQTRDFRCGTSTANRRRRSCERSHRIPCNNPSQKCPEPKPGQSPSQKHSAETQSEVPAKALDKRNRQKRSAGNATMGPHCRLSSLNWQKTPQWGPKWRSPGPQCKNNNADRKRCFRKTPGERSLLNSRKAKGFGSPPAMRPHSRLF